MKRLATGLFCALLLQSALTDTAEARPRHHRHHHVAVQVQPNYPTIGGFMSATGDLVQRARSYLGAGPEFGRSNLWCARFVNVVLKQTGHRGTGSDAALSFADRPAISMRPGAIAVMGRRGGGHVGIVSGVDASGNPIIISGNNGNRVREAVYPRSRIIKFVSAE